MSRRKTVKLYAYRAQHRASQTLAKLSEQYPNNTFKVVSSPLQMYAFMYLIECTTPDGKKSFVSKP